MLDFFFPKSLDNPAGIQGQFAEASFGDRIKSV